MSQSSVLEKPDTKPSDTGEGKVAHLAMPDDVTRGYIEGTPILTLCGIRFVPTEDPEKYPVCTKCIAARDRIRNSNMN